MIWKINLKKMGFSLFKFFDKNRLKRMKSKNCLNLI